MLLYILSGLLWRHLSGRLLCHRFLFRYILDFPADMIQTTNYQHQTA
jgi:hypothetical protein